MRGTVRTQSRCTVTTPTSMVPAEDFWSNTTNFKKKSTQRYFFCVNGINTGTYQCSFKVTGLGPPSAPELKK